MAEAALLSFLAPSARPLAPQVTALPPLAAYHDLRWLFAFNQSWLGFTGTVSFASGTGDVVAGANTDDDSQAAAASADRSSTSGTSSAPEAGQGGPAAKVSGAVLVVAGFGSTCCNSANALRAAEPNLLVRQFSYLGLNAACPSS